VEGVDGLPFPSTVISSGAVRGLLRALVAGPAGEDAFQQAWLEAAHKRVPPEELGHWLVGAAKRLTRARRRDEARRLEREQRAARCEAGPSTLDTLAQLELVKRVTAAVEALEEPYRTAVVLRYFEGLPPRRIARRLEVPVNTARSRVRRGIEELRTRLDPAALLALLPPASLAELVRPSGPSALLRRSWMRAAAGAAVLGVAGVVYSSVRAPERAAEAPALAGALSEPLAAAPPASRAASEVTPSAAPPAARVPVVVDSAGAHAGGGEAGADATGAADGLAEITGRLLGADGAPLVGAELALRVAYMHTPLHRPVVAAAVDEHPLDGWQDLALTTASDGRFRRRFEPPANLGFSLTLEAGGASHEWSWHAIAPGERIDLGTVRLDAGGAWAGRIVDEHGQPRVDEAWRVTGSVVQELARGHALETSAVAEVDARTAEFVLRGLPEGPLELRASAPNTGSLATLALEPEAGLPRLPDLVYAGPDPGRVLRLTVVVRGYPGRHAPAEAALVSADGTRRAPRPVDGSFATFECVDLGPEEHALVIEDPRFEPWRRDGLRAGEQVRVELTGSSALRLHVVARASGEVLERFGVVLEPCAPLPTQALRFHDGAAPLVGGRLPGLLPGSYLVRVGAPGFAEGEAEVLELAPGETRTLSLALEAAPTLAGHVRHADGRPAAGVTVVCLLADDDGSLRPPRARRELARGESDSRGAFRLELTRTGACVLAVLDPSTGAPLSAHVPAHAAGGVEGLALTVP
jgi:RNA polymerase sigma factor (sigma-70 family)